MAKLSSAELAEQYGFVSSLLNSDKGLKDLFQQAVKGEWSSDKFQAKLRNTHWWKTHSQDERDYLVSLKSDPATARQSYNQNYTSARQLANSLGIVESDFTMKKIKEVAYNMTAKGWSEAQSRYYLGQYISFSNNKHQGEGGDDWDQLHTYAYSMGVTKAGDWYGDASRKIVRGLATIQDYKSEINKQAKASFPQWSKQIDGGQTVADIASPYMQSMATILELPSGSTNLFDPTIKKALTYVNPATTKKEAMPLWQFENKLREDSRWKSTKNAQDSLMQVGHQVLTDFGVAF